MNETETQVKPNEEEVIVLDQEDFNFEENTEVEDTTKPTTEVEDTPVETKEEEGTDFTPLLDKLSKEIKYMDEEIKIDSLDNLKSTYQKGLNHDRLQEKLKELENSEEITYIRDKAKEMGMTPSEYIKAVKDYEVQQEKEKEQTELNEMIESGIAREIAEKVIETNRVAKELAQEKLKLKQQEEELAKQKQRDAENDAFISAYPDVNFKDIPKEVYLEAEKVGLLTAYTKYQNEQMKKELEILKQNQNNAKTSPVNGTTEHGGVVIEKEDPFLRGFNS